MFNLFSVIARRGIERRTTAILRRCWDDTSACHSRPRAGGKIDSEHTKLVNLESVPTTADRKTSHSELAIQASPAGVEHDAGDVPQNVCSVDRINE